MNELDIHYNWQIQNPDVHLFSWRGTGRKYSRLDYFLVSLDFEAFIVKSEIGIALSEHSPVSICLQFNIIKK
jgi:exonuclease III